MKAVMLNGHGGLDQLVFRDDVPVPVPATHEVLVRIRAASVNNTDINMRIGWYSKSVTAPTGATVSEQAAAEDAGWGGNALSFPRIQGADACGHIEAVGPGVDPGRIGQRVLIDPILRTEGGSPLYFGSDTSGAFAEYTVVPASNAHAINSAFSEVELASFPCAYLAAENMLTRAAIKADERVLVTGASGGVGSAAVQLARRRGAQVIAIAGLGKKAAIEALGAHRVLAREVDLPRELGPESVHAVIDVVGGHRVPQLLNVLARGGRYAVAGAIDGPVVELDLRTLYLKDLQMLGCTIPDVGVFDALLGYIERGEIQPVVSATYPLAAIADAQTEFMAKSHVGKIVLVV